MPDWYQHTSWNPKIETAFFTELSRHEGSVGYYHFLRRQAYMLMHSDASKYHKIAKELLLKGLEDPEIDFADTLISLDCLGNIYRMSGDPVTAILVWKYKIEHDREWQGFDGDNTILKLARLIAEYEIKSEYEDMYRLLSKKVETYLFPAELAEGYSILSLLSLSKGKKNESEKLRNIALGYGESLFQSEEKDDKTEVQKQYDDVITSSKSNTINKEWKSILKSIEEKAKKGKWKHTLDKYKIK